MTLSPGFDHEVHVDHLTPGEVGRVLSWRVKAAGKGLNVARFANALGGLSHAYALVGQVDEQRFQSTAATDGVRLDTFGVAGRTRDNLTLTSDARGPLAGHASGPRLANVPQAAVARLFSKLATDVSRGDVVVLTGALPDGLDVGTWARAARTMADAGAKVVLDVQGESMVAALRTGVLTMSKPNEDEVVAIPGAAAAGPPIARATTALRWMISQGVSDPVVSLGGLGAAHVRDGEVVVTRCAVDTARVVVAAGDAFVAGYCVGLDQVPSLGMEVELIELAVAAATAHVVGMEGLSAVHELVGLVETTRVGKI